jgi:ribulose-bisphosphate carboxylase large chain
MVKDDENLASQRFNSFEERVRLTLQMGDRAESETGEKKVYMPNVTAEAEEMLRRAELVKELGGSHVMIDIITCGFSGFQALRKKNLGLVIHAHRAGHAALTRIASHGIAMKVVAKAARIVGADQLHVGTVVGKMSEMKKEVLENVEAIKEPLYGLKPVFPVASGGLHPGLVPELIEIFGKDLIIQAGGGIHGHPGGTMKGSSALRQAVDAVVQGESLAEYAKTHQDLALALKTWKT